MERLRAHIDNLFLDAPNTRAAWELKEELLQNLTEKYQDLLNEGKTTDAAYSIAIASMGDVASLIAQLQGVPSYTKEQEEEIRSYRERKAKVTAISVALYIMAVLPPIFLSDDYGAAAMFIIVAIATGLLIYFNMNKPHFMVKEETTAEEFQKWRQDSATNKKLYGALSGLLWSLALVAYFVYSFLSGMWHISWLIFPVTGALNAVLKAVIDLKQQGGGPR